tara:strand:- start:299 stop:424 length:126 start_codon:yes stop_codon:yes gene_type:complete
MRWVMWTDSKLYLREGWLNAPTKSWSIQPAIIKKIISYLDA